MTLPPLPDSKDEDKFLREDLRRLLAALGLELPTTPQDVLETGKLLASLQEQITKALGIDPKTGANSAAPFPLEPEKQKNLESLQQQLGEAAMRFEVYSNMTYGEEADTKVLSPDKIQSLLKAGLITKEGAFERLTKESKLKDMDAQLLIEEAEQAPELSVQTLQAALASGAIDGSEFSQRLKDLNYNPRDIQILQDMTASKQGGSKTPSIPGQGQQPSRPALGPDFDNYMRRAAAPARANAGPKLPTREEFLSDYEHGFDSVVSGLKGLTPDEMRFARTELAPMFLSEYNGALAKQAQPFKFSGGGGGGGRSTGMMASPNDSKSIVPTIMPADFLSGRLTEATVKLLYEGSQRGAGSSGSRGGTGPGTRMV